ncbi:MAG: ABC transporter substrate-binding protein [Patescibacteria group bacterium]
MTLRHIRQVTKNRVIPSMRQFKHFNQVLNKTEKRILLSSIFILIISFGFLSSWYVITHRVEMPAVGGSYTEALVGEPQLINPLYASASDVDTDLVKLIYSGLTKWDAKQGFIPDLASAIFISEDGKTYTVRINEDAHFHNGTQVRSRDVLFTISAIQNPLYRSPLAITFQDVTVNQVDDQTISFELKQPNNSFLSALSVGILPSEIWGDVPPKNATFASFNIEPIGSGPYKFKEFSIDKKGSIKSYTLQRNSKYYNDGPLIESLIFKFFQDSDSALTALENKQVEGVNYVPANWLEKVESNKTLQTLNPLMMRQVSLFFNSDNKAELKTKEIRKGIAEAINKEEVVSKVLNGHANVIYGPILPSLDAQEKTEFSNEFNIENSKALIEKNTTKKEEEPRLSLTLTTIEHPEFMAVAQLIAQQLKEVDVDINIEGVAQERFFPDVLESKSFTLLLTGALLGAYPDPYPFWHSSQKQKGGLNLASYGNRNTDKILEDAMQAVDREEQIKKYKEFRNILEQEIPAVFLYQSTYTYAISSKINNISIDVLGKPSDRFSNITSWYIKTKKVLQ